MMKVSGATGMHGGLPLGLNCGRGGAREGEGNSGDSNGRNNQETLD